MGLKTIWQSKLTDLHTSDLEGLGQERYEGNGKVYRYQKNASATNLVAKGCCLAKIVTVVDDEDKRVLSPDAIATGPNTCLIAMPAGVPVTAIAKSGSNTGSFGWVQVAGLVRVSMRQAATAGQQTVGCNAIGTTVCGTYSEWGKAITGGGVSRVRCVVIASPLATTGVATVATAIVRVKCL